MFIRSERLFLRPGWAEDWEELLGCINDEAVVRNLAQVPWPYSAEAARDFVARGQDGKHPQFLVTVPGASGARLVGCIGLHPAASDRRIGDAHGGDADAAVELGYWIARPHWGRGYATEAARAALSVARALGHRRIGAAQFLDNPASGRVLEKLGFTPGAVSERWCRSRGEPVPARQWTREIGAPSDCDGSDDAAAADVLARMCA